MKEILELLKQQPKEVLQWIILELMKEGKHILDAKKTYDKFPC
jgi:hypothetical protein